MITLLLTAIAPTCALGQAGTNYDAAQRAQEDFVYWAMEGSRALQRVMAGGDIPSRIGTLPHATALAGTSPDCPASWFAPAEYKLGRTGSQEVVFAADYQSRLMAKGHLCTPIDTRLECIIVIGVILQEEKNVEDAEGVANDRNMVRWELNGHIRNREFLMAMKDQTGILTEPKSRKKLCNRIDDMWRLIRRLLDMYLRG